jgi:hypothetical protein
MAELLVQDTSLTAIANAIRAKAESAGALSFPGGFVDAISALAAFPEGINAIASGTYTPTQNISSIVTIQHGMKVRPNFAFILPESIGLEEAEYENSDIVWQAIFDQSFYYSDGTSSARVRVWLKSGFDTFPSSTAGNTSDKSECGYDTTDCRFYASSSNRFKAGVTYRWFAVNLTRT